MKTIRRELVRQEGRRFFKDADIAVCARGLQEWFDIPSHVGNITLEVSEHSDFEDTALYVFYYPSVHDRLLDCYGLTRKGHFEALIMSACTIKYLVQEMDLPPQGVLNISVEYEE